MSLEEYLKENKLSYRKFAKKVDINHAAIYRYAKRKATPSLKVAILINEATKGKVPMSSLLCE